MIGIQVTVPIACWRKGKAREYLESEALPPPSTCYGFLLSLVGETDRRAHIGARVTAAIVSQEPRRSAVLRTVWRVKKTPLGTPGNTRPDYQQLLTGNTIVLWLDSSGEDISDGNSTLEGRVRNSLDPAKRGLIQRFGGLSLGESTHLVDEINLFDGSDAEADCFVVNEQGRLTLPVWVDHVGSAGTIFVTGDITRCLLTPPAIEQLPLIRSNVGHH